MKVFCRLYCLYFFLGICFTAQAQQQEISGKVVNSSTHEPIPFVNIAIKELYKGTACNALGEFSFKVDSLPLILVISHLSYEKIEIEVTNQDTLFIELIPGKLLMDELVIFEKGNNEYAYKLIDKAYNLITRSRRSKQYGNAFYR